MSSVLLHWDAHALQLLTGSPANPEMSLLYLTDDLHGHLHGPYWSPPWSPVSRDLVVSVGSSSAWLETHRGPQRRRDGAANTTGLHGPAPLESIPAAELVHTGTSGPGPCLSAEGVLGPGVGVQLAAVGEIRSSQPFGTLALLQLVAALVAEGLYGEVGRAQRWGGLGRAQPYVGCPWLVPVPPPAPLSTEPLGSVVMKP